MKDKRFLAILFSLVMALGVAALAGCSGEGGSANTADSGAAAEEQQESTAGEEAVEEAADATADAEATPAASAEPVTITQEDIYEYCGMCHFTDVENMAMNSWSRDTIDWGIVESMIPFADDATIQGIVDYYADIEPPAQEGGMH